MNTFKTLALSLALCISFFAQAETNSSNQIGIGFQSSFPVHGLSVKYKLNSKSTIQGVISPIGTGTFDIRFFGARYLQSVLENKVEKLHPYVYGALGLMSFSYDILGSDESDSFFSFGVGAGAEYMLLDKLGVSAELGFGKFSVSGDAGTTGAVLGLGLHYYL